MFTKVTSVAAVILFATLNSSMAQDSGAIDQESGIPPGWHGPLANAFFLDTRAGVLRPREEIVRNWDRLPADQQALATKHCNDGTQHLTDNMKRLCAWVAER